MLLCEAETGLEEGSFDQVEMVGDPLRGALPRETGMINSI